MNFAVLTIRTLIRGGTQCFFLSILKCMKLYIAILSGDQVVSFAVLIQLERYTDSWRYTVYYFQHFEVHFEVLIRLVMHFAVYVITVKMNVIRAGPQVTT